MLLSIVQKRMAASSSSDNAITTSINDFFEIVIVEYSLDCTGN